ncbi:MAG TPA: transporter substrate-binding domain-containing protein [Aliidongia sp.]|uniref:transporter substrate-binding domain-containing protein n=1 Tax=Aliidongia sp. TaxID=1914230 RepID=UPI002DDDB049|nr:transporter substrate-binding domain-containing protein [Aliidongia sp.]HEV2675587.1 transporter substrate-binding domain-containing protein [Aliidongia sp.]
MKLLRYAAAALLMLGLATAARPAAAQTVDEILAKGSINIGVLVDLPPYGILNDKQEPDGYDIEVAKLLGKYMGVKVNLVQLTSPNRIPFLLTNKVDLIVATFGVTPERAKQVLFSIPYSAIENVVFAPKDKKITSMDDLKGLKIGVPRGTVQDVILSSTFGDQVKMSRFDDDPSTYQSLITHQVDAIAETGLTGDTIFAQNTGAGIERKFTLLQQPNGITMRKDQWNLHQWVNTFVYFVKNNGELNAIHEKWFHKPLPNLPTF